MLLSGDRTISGSTVITLADQMTAVFWSVSRFGRMAGAVSIISSIVAIGLLLVPKADYSTGIVRWLIDAWVAAGLVCLFWPLVIAVTFRRLSNAQKELSYEIDSDRILVRDGTGTVIGIPWSQVRRVTEAKSGFSIAIRPAGARWLCKRAFTADAIESLRRLAGTKLGAGAHLVKQV
jgi:YcxB-like protein